MNVSASGLFRAAGPRARRRVRWGFFRFDGLVRMFQRASRDGGLETFSLALDRHLTAGENAMRQPSILDVVHGIKSVVPTHPEVSAWWYTPPQRLRLAGDLPGSGSEPLVIEVVVEGAGTEIPCAQIAKELSSALSGTVVRVRMHRGDREERPLFRIVSQGKRSSSSEAPRPA
jgi:hypothetical protein